MSKEDTHLFQNGRALQLDPQARVRLLQHRPHLAPVHRLNSHCLNLKTVFGVCHTVAIHTVSTLRGVPYRLMIVIRSVSHRLNSHHVSPKPHKLHSLMSHRLNPHRLKSKPRNHRVEGWVGDCEMRASHSVL